jgi:carboxyl-terminal processing protease
MLLGILSLVGLGFGFGYISYPLLHTAPESSTAPIQESSSDRLAAEQKMNVYWEAWRLLEQDFFGRTPDVTQRTYGAIRGMVATYNDPYTYFIEPSRREVERDDLRGKFGGIGAMIEQTDAGYLLRPVPDQPAAQAGVLEGDLLLVVDDQEITTATPVEDVLALVRGPVGTEVTLVLRRTPVAGEAPQELTVRITRVEIETPSLEWRILPESVDGQVGYIRHMLFTERSATEMARALAELQEQGATRFILDLRGNPGGLVRTALDVASLWLDGDVVYIEQKASGETNTYRAAEGSQVAPNAPLVVIVDGGTASAGELLAGALQDSGRAQLLGQKTFGKGSVQLVHELPDQSSLHVTNAHWFTPNRRPISEVGLTPDIPVNSDEDALLVALALVEAVPVVDGASTTAQN